MATAQAVHILATLSNMRGPVATAEYAQSLDQEELQSIGAWYNCTTGCYQLPPKATITPGCRSRALNYHDDGGEIAAVSALLEEVPIAGTVITIDALHTTLDTAASIVEKHGADYLMTVKQNASETYEALVTMPWELATGRFSEDPEKATVASTGATSK